MKPSPGNSGPPHILHRLEPPADAGGSFAFGNLLSVSLLSGDFWAMCRAEPNQTMPGMVRERWVHRHGAAQVVDITVQAVEHEGFSFVDVLQPCVTFNNTYKKYNAMTEVLEGIPTNYEEAIAIAKRRDKLPIGILYKTKKPPFHRVLYEDWNPVRNRLSREVRIKKVERLLST